MVRKDFSMSDPHALESAAEEYIARGWECVPGDGKRPNLRDWPNNNYTLTEIKSAWDRSVEPALCVKMGKGSGLIDFECDTDAQQKLMLELFGGEVPETLRFSSSKGEHWLFEWPPALEGRHNISLPASDGTMLIVRIGNASQSVFPPSANKTWICGPNDGHLLPLPNKVLAVLLKAKQQTKKTPAPVGFVPCSADVEAAVAAMSERHPKRSGESDGSRRLFAVCCRAIEHNLSDEQTVQAVRTYAQQHPFPQAWTDADILKRLDDAEAKEGVVRGAARPRIRLDGNFSEVQAQIEEALGNRGVFQSNGELVRITSEGSVCPIHSSALITHAAEAAEFVKSTKNGDKSGLPTERQMKALHHAEEYSRLRELRGVSISPILLPTGEVVRTNGYNQQSGYYLHLEQEYPELMDTGDAVELLADLYHDFPTPHVGGFVAFLLTLVSRNVISGPTPLFFFDGNHPGCGKGLSVDIGSMIVDGHKASPYPGFPDNTEMVKYLGSCARRAVPMICFDNVEGQFRGPAIEAAITTREISTRVLGASEMMDAKLENVWAATGNGMTLSRDMQRRTIVIQIDSEPNPHLRSDFTHPDLLGYVRDNREKLFVAAISIVANHLREECPAHAAPAMGSFGEWDRIVRAAVINAGLPDPFDPSISDSEDDVDPEVAMLHKAWVFDRPMTTKKLVEAAAESEGSELEKLLRRCPDDTPSKPVPPGRGRRGRWTCLQEVVAQVAQMEP